MLWLGPTVAESVDSNDGVYGACLSEGVTS